VSSYAEAPGLVQSVENGGAGAGFHSLNQYLVRPFEDSNWKW
jgi:hypothetical protein